MSLQLGSEVAVYRTLNQRSICEDVLWTPHPIASDQGTQQVSCDLGESRHRQTAGRCLSGVNVTEH